ncbi:hypothetical protein QCI42_09230 [Bacillus fungorum]|uniref:hypothetical protein n=1 Tax=Bacillus fungorum TaxID=2039284 RepID=UPI003395F574
MRNWKEDEPVEISSKVSSRNRNGIYELKEIFKSEPLYRRLSLINGFVVNQETRDRDWKMVIENLRIPKENIDKKNLDLQTNLDLSQETIDGINELKNGGIYNALQHSTGDFFVKRK